jgi:F-type H+-transporting ATPase subunit a
MIQEAVQHVAEHGHEVVQQVAEHGQAAQHAAEHGGEAGVGFMLHHIMAQPLIHLPTVWGIDLTITNHTLMTWIVSLILIVAFGRAFRRRDSLVPRGRLANALEALVLYIRDNVIIPNLGHNANTYAPYLLTAFFFVLLCNLMGLIPGAATATGNIGVTAGLAIMTLITVIYAGIRQHGLFGYMKTFLPHGIPWWLSFVMIPVEVMSLLTKHFALTIRLFANMIAGHLTILSLMSIIFIFRSYYVAPFPLAIMIFSSLLEILIAFIQAYVFTILSSVFISASLASEH